MVGHPSRLQESRGRPGQQLPPLRMKQSVSAQHWRAVDSLTGLSALRDGWWTGASLVLLPLASSLTSVEIPRAPIYKEGPVMRSSREKPHDFLLVYVGIHLWSHPPLLLCGRPRAVLGSHLSPPGKVTVRGVAECLSRAGCFCPLSPSDSDQDMVVSYAIRLGPCTYSGPLTHTHLYFPLGLRNPQALHTGLYLALTPSFLLPWSPSGLPLSCPGPPDYDKKHRESLQPHSRSRTHETRVRSHRNLVKDSTWPWACGDTMAAGVEQFPENSLLRGCTSL